MEYGEEVETGSLWVPSKRRSTSPHSTAMEYDEEVDTESSSGASTPFLTLQDMISESLYEPTYDHTMASQLLMFMERRGLYPPERKTLEAAVKEQENSSGAVDKTEPRCDPENTQKSITAIIRYLHESNLLKTYIDFVNGLGQNNNSNDTQEALDPFDWRETPQEFSTIPRSLTPTKENSVSRAKLREQTLRWNGHMHLSVDQLRRIRPGIIQSVGIQIPSNINVDDLVSDIIDRVKRMNLDRSDIEIDLLSYEDCELPQVVNDEPAEKNENENPDPASDEEKERIAETLRLLRE